MSERFSFLFNRYVSGKADSAELAEFYELLGNGDSDALTEKAADQLFADDIYHEVEDENDAYYPAGAASRMLKNIFESEKEKQKRRMFVKLWATIGVAAAIAIIGVSAMVWFLTVPNESKNLDRVVYQNDISPGKTGATLTLANGKKIKLDDAQNGELATEAGVSITKSATGQLIYEIHLSPANEISTRGQAKELKYNVLSTARGETYQVRLPDGSQVWLNALSGLTYTANLVEKGKRRVKLDGEAYFEIAKDKQHPFIVETSHQQTEVLGTHFNINSYKDEKFTVTTLLEGSVKVSGGNDVVLTPGQQSIATAGSIKVVPANIRETMAWKNGFFRFKEMGIDEVMTQLNRWYDIDVVYDGKIPEEKFSGAIARNKNISEVLTMLSYTRAVKFKIEGRKVTVMK